MHLRVTFLLALLAVLIAPTVCQKRPTSGGRWVCSANAPCDKNAVCKMNPDGKIGSCNMEPCEAVDKQRNAILHNRVTSQNSTIMVNNLVKRFGDHQAVNGVFLGVQNDECFGLLGVNGAGKSTTIEILTCNQLACSGIATIGGVGVDHWVKLGYCPQFDATLPDLTCLEHLEIMARLQNYQNPSELAHDLLECVGMLENASKRVKYCSGGQKRKLSMAMTILSRGSLVILDEPTAGVDPKARRDLWDIVGGLRQGDPPTGVLLTSHSMEECEALCTRIGILRKGEMIALGSSQELKSQYGNTFTLTMEVDLEAERGEILRRVRENFGDGTILLSDEMDLNMVWELPRSKTDKWSMKMDMVKTLADDLKIDNYYLVQSSLEDIFIKMNSENIEKKEA